MANLCSTPFTTLLKIIPSFCLLLIHMGVKFDQSGAHNLARVISLLRDQANAHIKVTLLADVDLRQLSRPRSLPCLVTSGCRLRPLTLLTSLNQNEAGAVGALLSVGLNDIDFETALFLHLILFYYLT